MKFFLAVFSAATALARITVNFPGDDGSEYTERSPIKLPKCESNTWNITGQTYDEITECSSDSKTKISVIPFRCASYCRVPNARGVYECEKCYYGWGQQIVGKIDPWLSEEEAKAGNETFSRYFVPQIFSQQHNLRSCLMVTDKNLLSYCDRIIRLAPSPNGSPAVCVKNHKSIPFEKPLVDFDLCKKYDIVNGKLSCQSS